MTRLVLPVGLAALVLVAGAVSAPAAPPFRVVSTLDGKTVLPHRIRWIASTTLPSSRVARVDFLVDGKVRWSWNEEPPYVFSGHEHLATHEGYLVTSWLTPGKHRFTARVVAVDGRRADDTVAARVLPAPVVPAALQGTWQRTIADVSGAPPGGTPGNPTDTSFPAGRFTLTFARQWIEDRFPGTYDPIASQATGAGYILDSDWTPGPTTLSVAGPVTIQPFHDTDQRGGSWCWWDGPAATYAWTVSGDTLTLAAVGGKDACTVRGFVWAGSWTRVH